MARLPLLSAGLFGICKRKFGGANPRQGKRFTPFFPGCLGFAIPNPTVPDLQSETGQAFHSFFV
jgi:hypothetical protein